MNCPTCGWGVILIKEFEESDMVVGNYKCGSCPVLIEIKSPIKWMVERGRWP
jgi:ribosomal protein S27AE